MYSEFIKKIKLVHAKDSGNNATFVPNKKLPVYNWFYYKEGFSRDLVFSLLEEFSLLPGNTVLDPFCGSGTTLLACRQKGISSVGFDVLPISAFAAKVKTSDYDPQELKDIAKALLKTKFYRIDYAYPPFMKSAFSRFALEDISVFRKAIMEIPSKKLRDFFLLSLISAAMKCSYAWKDGGVIKFRRRSVPPLRFMLRRTIYNMIRDIEHLSVMPCTTVVEVEDARRLKLDDFTIDAIITSPPYLNNIDYTKVYEIEQFILHEHEKPPIRSYIGLDKEIENKILPELDLPPSGIAYFTDMLSVLKEMHRVLKVGGKAAIVVGNAYIKNIIDSDMIVSYLAEKNGFSVQEIRVLNERFALEERTNKKGILRESLIILEKL